MDFTFFYLVQHSAVNTVIRRQSVSYLSMSMAEISGAAVE